MTCEANNPLTQALWDILWEMEKLDSIFESAVLMMYLQVECNLQLQETKGKKPLESDMYVSLVIYRYPIHDF